MLRLYKHHSFLMSHNEWTLPHFRDSQLVFQKNGLNQCQYLIIFYILWFWMGRGGVPGHDILNIT